MALSGWNSSQKFACTIDTGDVPSTQTDFPVLLNIAASAGKSDFDLSDIFAKLGSNSLKIAVEDGDTGNQCCVEIERWDNGDNSAQLWVKVPSVSSSADTVLNFYYDETQADNSTYVGIIGSTPGIAVWSNSYARVYHLSQTPSGSGSIKDSLTTTNGTSVNMDSSDLVAAHVGKGLEFNGTDEHVTFAFGSNFTTATAEISCIGNGGEAMYDGIFSAYSDVGNYALTLIVYSSTVAKLYIGAGTESSALSVPNWSAWRHFALTLNSSEYKLRNMETAASVADTTDRAYYVAAYSALSRWYNDSRRFPGKMRGLFISSVVRSEDWLTLSYKSRTDSLITYSMGTSFEKFSSGVQQLWFDGVEEFSSGVQQSWQYLFEMSAGILQQIKIYLEAGVRQRWLAAPVFSAGLAQWWQDASRYSAGGKQSWVAPLMLSAGILQKWLTPAFFSAGLQQVFPVCGGSFSSGLQQLWRVSAKEQFIAGLAQPWADIGAEEETTTYTISAVVGGSLTLSPSLIRISGNEYYMQCELTLHAQDDFLQCRRVPVFLASLDAQQRAAALAAASLVITDTYNTYQFYIFSKARARSRGETVYTIIGQSVARLLDAPYALPFTQAYAAEMWSAVAAAVVADHGVTLTWGLVDEYLPADTLYANDETPLTVLRKLVDAQGGSLQSTPAGTLVAGITYPVSPPEWGRVAVAAYLKDLNDFFSDSESDEIRDGYNSFQISDHTTASDNLRLEETAISATVIEVRAYVIPWSDDPLPFDTSGPDRVTIAAPEIVEKLIEGEEVEFVSGEGKTEKPIYDLVKVDYHDNLQLGVVDWSEDGTLTTEVAGQSLCTLDYKTKYWKWLTTDAVAEPVQFWTKAVWGDTPVSIVVRFGDAAASTAKVVIEPDETLNRDADGNILSEFPPDTPFYFLVQIDDTVQVTSITTSDGRISDRGTVTRNKTQRQVFIDTNPVALPTIPAGPVTPSWYGRSPNLTISGVEVSVDDIPAIAELTWQARMESYMLTPPDIDLEKDEKYYIVILLEVSSL